MWNIDQFLVGENAVDNGIAHFFGCETELNPAELVKYDAIEEFGLNVEWANNTDFDLIIGIGHVELDSKRFGEADNREFRRAVVGEFVAALKAANRCDIYNVTSIFRLHVG